MVRLSVAMTNYNHGNFLEERISSILEQLENDDELVIVDDASTDNSVSIIEKFVQRDSRIRLITQPQNLGVVKSANRAFKESKGAYLASLSADDRLLPGFIKKTMNVLLEHPDIPLCCSECTMWFDGFPDISPDRLYTTKLIEGSKERQIFFAKDLVKIFQKTTFWIPGHTTIIKRDLVLAYGGLNEKLGYLCDWFLLHSIALNHGVAYLPEELSVWRQDSKSYSKQKISFHEEKNIYLQVLAILSKKENKTLRSLFRRSLLFRFYIRKIFFHLLKKPQHWDFLIYTTWRVLIKRTKRYSRYLKI